MQYALKEVGSGSATFETPSGLVTVSSSDLRDGVDPMDTVAEALTGEKCATNWGMTVVSHLLAGVEESSEYLSIEPRGIADMGRALRALLGQSETG